MKIAVCQINPVIGDFENNISLIKDATDRAKKAGCVLAIFPEMSLPGHPARDLLQRHSFIDKNLIHLDRLSLEIKGISILCGYVDRDIMRAGNPLINSVALIKDGRVIATGGKRLLPNTYANNEAQRLAHSSKSLIFDLERKKVGVTICEDIWDADVVSRARKHGPDPAFELISSGIEILVNVSASPYVLNKGVQRLTLLKELSTMYRISTIYCNQVGGNDELIFDGSSMVVDRKGRLICLGRQFESDLLVWDTGAEYEEIKDPWPPEEKSILNALIMGTRDYASKCGFKKVLIGLSGGIDSSLVAFIAREAMGAENVMGVSMPSPYTSEMSREDAGELARNLGIRFEEIPIHDLFQNYQKALAPHFKGLNQDHTEENIQARIRSNLLMAMSNKFNALLLATGNKSELAVGYCTMYGDLTGGLAVISDVPKTLCYRLANHINKNGEVIPPRIVSRPPSAELRPSQTDQDTLPPYELLDDILQAAVEKDLGFDDIVALGHDPAVVSDVLHRLAFSEYKRRQAPPGLRITTRAFGDDRRYPVARGREVY